ncbi:glycosyltransferase WbuB [Mesobacillus zeae]|uniref:Glycosyltransferase WbuB n=2 Tax=Mesobacillus zeae TaxID=1917180 RepID=A0A398B1D5_9BACI|nr:glycosyltransferase WbuB [Mesobacillus zeae]
MCQYFYPEYVSSATLPTELAEDLVKKGVSVDVVCGYPQVYFKGTPVTEKEDYKGIGINRVKYTQLNNKSKIGRIINFFSFFVSVLFKMPFLFKYKTILVYSNPPILPLIPYLVSRFSKTKFIFVAFDVYPDNALILGAIKNGSFIGKLMKYINSKVYRYSSAVVALSNDMKDYLIEHKIAIKPEIIKVIPNWYSHDKLDTNGKVYNEEFKELRKKWKFIVLYSGNMGSAQDIETILESMKKFKNSKDILFLFSGHGNKEEHVKEYIETNRIKNTRVYGFLLGNDYSDILQIADVCLVSLAKGIEGIGVPSKTYGYLAAGKPVLAIMSKETDIAKDLTKYQAGGCVEQGDSIGLQNLLLSYSDNKEILITSAAQAKKLYEKYYTREICTEKYYKLIKEIK